MTDLRRRYLDDMTLHGLAPTTQKVYVHAVEKLAQHYGRSPALLSEQELRVYSDNYIFQETTITSFLMAGMMASYPIWLEPWRIGCQRRNRTRMFGGCG